MGYLIGVMELEGSICEGCSEGLSWATPPPPTPSRPGRDALEDTLGVVPPGGEEVDDDGLVPPHPSPAHTPEGFGRRGGLEAGRGKVGTKSLKRTAKWVFHSEIT